MSKAKISQKNKVITGILGLFMAGTIGTANAYDLTRTDYEPSRLEHIIENHFKTKDFHIKDVDYKTNMKDSIIYEVEVIVNKGHNQTSLYPSEHELLVDYRKNKVIRDIVDD